MQITKYGIELKRLSNCDLEQVRAWRNLDHVRLNMEYKNVIEPQQQKDWFNNLDIDCNYYFIVFKNKKAIGVVNLKDINHQSKTAEAGIFIGQKEYLNTLVPILATITIMEFAFETLLLKTLKAKIEKQNQRAILFNQSIGYVSEKESTSSKFQYYYTTEILFKKATQKLRSTLDKLK